MITVFYIISIIIMLANVFSIYILINSINANKTVKTMNDIIEYTNSLRHHGKFIIRNEECKSLGYLMHIAINNNEPILILDIDSKSYENQ